MDTNISPTPNTGTISGFAFGVAFSVGIFLLVVLITFASYLCQRGGQSSQYLNTFRRVNSPEQEGTSTACDGEQGIDEATLCEYPMLPYSKAEYPKSEEACCSICLGKYEDDDAVRLLPNCTHLFHQKCIDPWLRLHASCPMCRKSLANSQHAIPLADQRGTSTEQS